MTLGFSQYWPGTQTQTLFKEKILLPHIPYLQTGYPLLLPKIHTFRVGHRWRAGMKIHMVTGNRTPHRNQFNTDIPALSTCISAQDAVVHLLPSGKIYIGYGNEKQMQSMSMEQLLLFAANDGFNSLEELILWFFPSGRNSKLISLEGQIIHWTKFQY